MKRLLVASRGARVFVSQGPGLKEPGRMGSAAHVKQPVQKEGVWRRVGAGKNRYRREKTTGQGGRKAQRRLQVRVKPVCAEAMV